MSSEITFIALASVGIVNYAFIFRWWVMPYLYMQPHIVALQALFMLHSFRMLGIFLLGPSGANLPQEAARFIAYGDITAGILALIAALSLRSNLPLSLAMGTAWLANTFGFLDMFNSFWHVLTGTLDNAGDFPYWIAIFYIPALIISHLYIFQLLLRRGASHDASTHHSIADGAEMARLGR